MRASRPIFAFALFLCAGFLTAAPAWAADLVVVASTAPGIEPGRIVAAGEAVTVPDGRTVTLVSETGKAVVLEGPHSGPAAAPAPGAKDPKLLGALAKLMKGDGRGTESLGTMRAAPGRAEPPPDPWLIDVGASGDHCVPDGAAVTLWRGHAGRPATLIVKNLMDRTKASVPWAGGAATVGWPEAVTLQEGARYLLRLTGSRGAGNLVLHLVPADLAMAAHRARWMAETGCRAQARRLLAELR